MQAALSQALDSRFPAGDTDPGERSQRESALAAFAEHGYPHRRIEQWRYTDLGALTRSDFDFAPAVPGEEALGKARAKLESLPYPAELPRAVFVDGFFSPELSLLPGLLSQRITPTASRPARPGRSEPRHALTTLNDALASSWRLDIGADFPSTQPVLLAIVTTGAGIAPQLQFEVSVEAGAQARLIQHLVSADGAGAAWTNIVIDIDQAADSRLEVMRIQTLAADQSITTAINSTLHDDARQTIGSIDIGGSIVRTEVDAALAAPGAAIDMYGLSTAAGKGHVDNQLCADHRAPDTNSNQTFRSIIDDRGRVVFNGKVIVRQDAQRIDAHQKSDNLLLSPQAEIDTKPELEIYADDVRCSHGATVGELDASALFYLQSRGVSAAEARRLLTFAFANSILHRIEEPALYRHLARTVATALDAGQAAADEQIRLEEFVE